MSNHLTKLIQKKKSALLKQWFESVIQSYAPDTAAFLKGQKDPFANPVGNATMGGLDPLFDQLTGEMDQSAIRKNLDPIIRIRAVQDFTPSQAVAFVFSVKAILRENLKNELQDIELAKEFVRIESNIDTAGLLAFDIFMACREKIFDLKANETRNRVFSAFERAGLVAEAPENH